MAKDFPWVPVLLGAAAVGGLALYFRSQKSGLPGGAKTKEEVPVLASNPNRDSMLASARDQGFLNIAPSEQPAFERLSARFANR